MPCWASFWSAKLPGSSAICIKEGFTLIVELLITGVLSSISWLLGLIPSFVLPAFSIPTEIISVFRSISAFVPIGAFSVCVTVWSGIQAFKLASSIVNWILRKFLIG